MMPRPPVSVPPPTQKTARVQPLGKTGSQAMSLMEEMKIKQEQRDRRRLLKKELESCGQAEIVRKSTLRSQLAAVENYLVQVDGAQALMPDSVPIPTAPSCVREDLESANLYVGSLAAEWTEELISREFGRFGDITSIKIMYPRTGLQRVRGMTTGFVQFATRKQAEKAKTTMNGREYYGMALRIEFARPVEATRSVGSRSVQPHLPSAVLANLPVARVTDSPAPAARGNASVGAGPAAQDALASARRESRFDKAKTYNVVPPDGSMRRLIDQTAEFVAAEGWEFEKLLLEREHYNPKFAFLSADEGNVDNPHHVYYRWRTFAFAQGDSDEQWRTEQLQLYENGAIWQPPPCNKKDYVEEDDPPSPVVARIDLITSRICRGAGSGELSVEDARSLDSLLFKTRSDDRQSILKAMVFCLDNASSSQAITNQICTSILDLRGRATATLCQVMARLFLLSDVLFNAHCSKPGASMYRRKFQEHLPNVFEALRGMCHENFSKLEAANFRESCLRLLRIWVEWSSFPRQFAQGLEATLCQNTSVEVLQQLQVRWEPVQQISTLERECKLRGLSTKGNRSQLVDRLCRFESYWGERVAPWDPNGEEFVIIDPELDGEPLDESESARLQEEWKAFEGAMSFSSTNLTKGPSPGTLGAGLASCRAAQAAAARMSFIEAAGLTRVMQGSDSSSSDSSSSESSSIEEQQKRRHAHDAKTKGVTPGTTHKRALPVQSQQVHKRKKR